MPKALCRHSSHTAIFRQAIICALKLADTPTNADKELVFLNIEPKLNHARLQASEKYRPVGGIVMTRDEARDMLAPYGGASILDTNLANHQNMKKKGGLGVSPLILEVHGIVDVVNIALPSHDGAKKARAAMDWGENWVSACCLCGLRGLIQLKIGHWPPDGFRNGKPGHVSISGLSGPRKYARDRHRVITSS